MTFTVYKYKLDIAEKNNLTMPIGAKVLRIGLQGGLPFLWALVKKEETRTEERLFRLAGTGHDIEVGVFTNGVVNLPTYIGTVDMLADDNSSLVFHLFEIV